MPPSLRAEFGPWDAQNERKFSSDFHMPATAQAASYGKHTDGLEFTKISKRSLKLA